MQGELCDMRDTLRAHDRTLAAQHGRLKSLSNQLQKAEELAAHPCVRSREVSFCCSLPVVLSKPPVSGLLGSQKFDRMFATLWAAQVTGLGAEVQQLVRTSVRGKWFASVSYLHPYC